MVNKVALGILAVIVLTAMTVGGLVGLQLGEPGGLDGTPTPTPTATSAPTPTAGPDGNGGAGNGEATPTPTTPTPVPTVSPSRFNETKIAEEIRAEINVRRQDRSMRTLPFDEPVHRMALNHSENMAEQGFVSHAAGGFSTAERYEAFGLADRCRVPDNSNTGIREDRALETLYKTTAGQPYTVENETRMNANESQVAAVVVRGWFEREDTRRKLLLQNAEAAGVGVVVTDAGAVYVTTNLC